MLCVDQIAIDIAGMFERGLDGALCDFVERHATDARVVANVVRLRFGLLSLLFLTRVFAELVGEMGGDGFAFAIRVRREVDVVGRERQLLELGEDLLFPGNDNVFGFEIVFDVDTETAFGQVFHVAERSIDRESLAQILLDSFRLSRRFDND